jgi:hypothetical protein
MIGMSCMIGFIWWFKWSMDNMFNFKLDDEDII